MGKLQKGEDPVSTKAHSDAAAHHNVSVNHFAKEVTELISSGTINWKKFGGVHPSKFGNTMCAAIIEKALLKKWSEELPSNAEKIEFPVKSLLDKKSYIRGRFIDNVDVELIEDFVISVPDWSKKPGGTVRRHFAPLKLLHSSKAGASLKVKFKATAIGAYMLAGKDSAVIRCIIDDGEPKDIDTIHRYSGFNYPRTIIFFDDLEDKEHVLKLEILENREGRIKKGGTALRIINFTAN